MAPDDPLFGSDDAPTWMAWVLVAIVAVVVIFHFRLLG